MQVTLAGYDTLGVNCWDWTFQPPTSVGQQGNNNLTTFHGWNLLQKWWYINQLYLLLLYRWYLVLLMARIRLTTEVGSLSTYLQDFVHPRRFFEISEPSTGCYPCLLQGFFPSSADRRFLASPTDCDARSQAKAHLTRSTQGLGVPNLNWSSAHFGPWKEKLTNFFVLPILNQYM